MMLALWGLIALIGLTGCLQETDRYFGVSWIAELHEIAAWIATALVGLHLAAAIVASSHEKINLP